MESIKFKSGAWEHAINVRDFVQNNITPYHGDASFLCGPTERTKKLWKICTDAIKEELDRDGVRSIDTETVSTIDSHGAGYIDKDLELIVGLQADELLRRAMKPYGGIAVVEKACTEHGLEVSDRVKDIFHNYAKTHNDGVFDAYTEEIRKFRSLGFLTGLPDNYARGRIIGDYRRMALYGIDRLIEAKQEDLKHLTSPMSDDTIRLREEVAEQIKALGKMKILVLNMVLTLHVLHNRHKRLFSGYIWHTLLLLRSRMVLQCRLVMCQDSLIYIWSTILQKETLQKSLHRSL